VGISETGLSPPAFPGNFIVNKILSKETGFKWDLIVPHPICPGNYYNSKTHRIDLQSENGDGGGGEAAATASEFGRTGIADPNKPNSKAVPMDYKIAAKKACDTKYEDAASIYPLITIDRLPYVCMDLTYQYTLLVDGFRINPWEEITVTQQIEYEDTVVDASWPLGNAIEALSSLPTFERLMYFI
ncbi:hypothetical protein PIB30_081121, partial [Stylosanthes scabra]|nr:hypothetical protein [Stylosanthes scabra]